MLQCVYICYIQTALWKRRITILPIERQNCIKELLEKHGSMKISDLSQKLSVSEMTIHRDLKPLIDEGFLIKTFGGVTLSKKIKDAGGNSCVYCHQNITEKLSFRLVLNDHTIETACCSHCGLLRFRQIDERVEQVMCQDFLRSTTINAKTGYFVMDTTLNLGCCQPQVLPFKHKEEAEKFIKGFGGRVSTFHEAKEIVYNEMSLKDN